MKSLHINCDCMSPEHTLRYIWDAEDKQLYTDIYLNSYQSFFKRFVIAIKYLFGHKCKYGMFDCTMINEEQFNNLYIFLTQIRLELHRK